MANIQAQIIELLGDIINVHSKVADDNVVIKMNSKYAVKEGDGLKVAVDFNEAKFFNKTTGKAITPEYCKYEEVVVTDTTDEDKVVIVEQKPQGFFSKTIASIKSKIKASKDKKKNDTLADGVTGGETSDVDNADDKK